MMDSIFEQDRWVSMRDGVRLATDIYRPQTDTPVPTLVMRTPYNKQNLVAGSYFDPLRAVQEGYAVVVQDVRGRYASEGTFAPMVHETSDGVDTFAWAAAQPWSSGMVGTFGGSYLGATQWLPARENPPALKAMATSVTFSDMYAECAYQGGAKVLHDLRWVVADTIPAELHRRRARGEALPEGELELDVETILQTLPLAQHPLIQEVAPFYTQWLAHASAGEYWQAISPNSSYKTITAPVLNIGGWYDIFLRGTLQSYLGMRHHSKQRLVVGPWSHMNFSGCFPERDFGPAASSEAIDLNGLQLRWFDRWLKGEENGVEQEPPVLIFVMGTDEWRTAADWPLPGTQYRPYYLREHGQLLTEHPGDEAPDTFLFNPLDPVPTVGGQVILPGENTAGPRDQRMIETRDDVLVYTTPPLEQAVTVIGPVELCLFVSSSARDTDFTGKLVDVWPDGRAMLLTEGILRARYRDSPENPESLVPGAIYALHLDLWATANVFLPGHSIRLEVSSSNFPRFDRNSNTGDTIAQEPVEAYQSATNQVFHRRTHPSHLLLPLAGAPSDLENLAYDK